MNEQHLQALFYSHKEERTFVSNNTEPCTPLYGLWHPGTAGTLSGYGLAVEPGHRHRLVDLLMVDRPNPAIVFFTGAGDWAPIEVVQVLGGRRVYARLTEDGKDVVVANPALQADLAEFADMWANNIEAQGWLEHSQRYQPRKLQAPDLETLIEWMVDDGGCEATDTCTCDGRSPKERSDWRAQRRCRRLLGRAGWICPHGCQSWFLVMGLI